MAIMADMGPGHQKAIVTDGGFHTATFGARIKGCALADFGAFANDQAAVFALEFQVLRGMTNRGKGINFALIAKGGVTCDRDVAVQFDTITQDNIRTDHAIGSDFDILTNLRAIFDNGGWMYF